MRAFSNTSAAACAAVGLAMAAGPEHACAETPVAVEGADDSARDAIKALLPDRDAPTTLFDAERLSEEAAARALAWLRSEGYYEGAAEPDAEENPVRARVRVTLGPRFQFSGASIAYDAPEPAPEAIGRVTEAIKLAPLGRPARAADVLAAEAAAVSQLQASGYPDAEAGDRQVIVDHATDSMTANYRFRAGDRARLGVLRADPSDVLRPGFLEDVRNWRPGDLYTPEALARLRRDVGSTGAVARVSTRLEADPLQPGVRDVVLEIEAAKRHAFEFGAGYSTTEGVGVDAQWTWRNFTHRADTFTVETTLGELNQGVTVELTRPHAAGLGRAARFTATAERELTEAYDRTGLSLAASVDAETRLRYGVSYGVSLAADQYDDASGGSNAITLAGFAEMRRDTTGNPLDAREGDITELRIEPSVATGDASIGFLRATAEARTYESFGEDQRATFAARARLGYVAAIFGSDEDIPPDRRFYAGGGGSVRGYAYNSIYPEARKVTGATPGGQALTEISAEMRYRFDDHAFNGLFANNLGLAAFVDGGNAYDDLDDALSLKWGVGVGLRYNLGFAPLRVDLAVPLDPSDSDPDFALYVSLGQAF